MLLGLAAVLRDLDPTGLPAAPISTCALITQG